MKVIIATGGTGGHIFTGLAIAEELKSRDPRAQGTAVLIVAQHGGMERTIIKDKYPLKFTCQRPLVGKGIAAKIQFPFFLAISLIQSLYILMREAPDAVIGTGGFGSFSIVFIAAISGIPTIITEIDSIPGLATSILSRFVDEVMVAFTDAKSKLPGKKVRVTGFPVRKEITNVGADFICDRKSVLTDAAAKFGLSAQKPIVLVFGGSRGAQHINEVMRAAIPLLPDLQFIWQTGNYNTSHIVCDEPNVHITKFIEDMPSAYRCAKLAIARAGALTIGELIAANLPSILIPYPYAAKNHQLLNARRLEKIGAAKIILDHELTPELLVAKIKEIIENEEEQLKMRTAIKTLDNTNAAQLIAERVVQLCKRQENWTQMSAGSIWKHRF